MSDDKKVKDIHLNLVRFVQAELRKNPGQRLDYVVILNELLNFGEVVDSVYRSLHDFERKGLGNVKKILIVKGSNVTASVHYFE